VAELTLVGGVGRDVGVRWGVRPNDPWWYNSTPLGLGSPSFLGISPDGTELYVTNYSQHTVTAVSIT
jgi:hypothetical protein